MPPSLVIISGVSTLMWLGVECSATWKHLAAPSSGFRVAGNGARDVAGCKAAQLQWVIRVGCSTHQQQVRRFVSSVPARACNDDHEYSFHLFVIRFTDRTTAIRFSPIRVILQVQESSPPIARPSRARPTRQAPTCRQGTASAMRASLAVPSSRRKVHPFTLELGTTARTTAAAAARSARTRPRSPTLTATQRAQSPGWRETPSLSTAMPGTVVQLCCSAVWVAFRPQ